MLAGCAFAPPANEITEVAARSTEPTTHPSLTPQNQPTAAQSLATVKATETATLEATPREDPTESFKLLPVHEIPTLPAGLAITITEIQMIDVLNGWAIGGLLAPGERVLRTEDAGASWQDVSPPSHLGDSNLAIAAHFGDADEAWAIYFHPDESEAGGLTPISHGVWHTQNGGATWQASQVIESEFIGNAFERPHLYFVDSQQGWLMLRLGAVGTHRAPVYFYQTADGGATWTLLSDPYQGEYLQSCEKTSIAFADPHTGWVTIGSCPRDPHVEMTSDGGASWSVFTLPPLLGDYAGSCWDTIWAQFFGLDVGMVLVHCFREGAANGDHFLHRTDNGGQDWLQLPFPGQTALFLSPDLGWAFGDRVYQTTDGGHRWQDLGEISWRGQFSFVDADLGWAAARSDDGRFALVRTTDGGGTWTLIEPVTRGD